MIETHEITTPNGPIIILNLDVPWGECCICEKETPLGYSVGFCCEPTHAEIGSIDPIYGMEVGGMVACKDCHDEFYYGEGTHI